MISVAIFLRLSALMKIILLVTMTTGFILLIQIAFPDLFYGEDFGTREDHVGLNSWENFERNVIL